MASSIEIPKLSRSRILWLSRVPRDPPESVTDWTGMPPKLFYSPCISAGIEIDEVLNFRSLVQALEDSNKFSSQIAFVYNLQAWHLFAMIALKRRINFAIYYQNSLPNRLSLLKRVYVKQVLRLAKVAMLQDSCCLDHFNASTYGCRSVFFPWYVDEEFFDPTKATVKSARERFLFVPGDRGRLDSVVLKIAQRTDFKIVRVSRNFSQAALHAYESCKNVELKHFVRWDELRDLYASAFAVLNAVDDSENSAGMTTFLESLAMNAKVITPNMHCSNGFEFQDGYKPYKVIKEPGNVQEWLDAIKCVNDVDILHPTRSPRSLLIAIAGQESMKARWRELVSGVAVSLT